MSTTGKWEIGYEDAKHQKRIEDKYKSDTMLLKRWEDFERDVTSNPYYHPKYQRIVPLKDIKLYPPGSYRYKKEPIRVAYYPEGSKKIVYPLEVGTTQNISYKKKSSR